jgi:hypothetical protein
LRGAKRRSNPFLPRGDMDCFASLAMTEALACPLHISNSPPYKHGFAISPRLSREVCFEVLPLRNQRAQGMPGAHRARSLACKIIKAHEHSHHGHTGFTRHSPRNGSNGFLRALPGDRACLSPSPALLLADLTPASRRQDHTTSPSASGAIRPQRYQRPPHPAPRP